MNLPWRSTSRILRPARALSAARREPIRMRFPVISALRIFRPAMAGRRVRTTVSTSGSSGMFGLIFYRKIGEDVAIFNFCAVDRNASALVDQAGAGGGIEFPHVPWANHHAAEEASLPEGSAVVGADTGERAE